MAQWLLRRFLNLGLCLLIRLTVRRCFRVYGLQMLPYRTLYCMKCRFGHQHRLSKFLLLCC